MIKFIRIYISLFLLLCSSTAFATNRTVGTAGDFDPASYGGDVADAIEACAAASSDGDHCKIISGTYNNVGAIYINDTMTAETFLEPVTDGAVIFTGAITFRISGDYWTIRGFEFSGLTYGTGSPLFVLQADNIDISDHYCHDNGDTTDASTKFVTIGFADADADDAHIHHNRLDNHNGKFIHTDMTGGPSGAVIEYNYVGNVARNDAAQVTSMQLGDGVTETALNATVRYNVFEKFYGDSTGEFLEVKANGVTVEYNIFLNCDYLSLRTGNDNIIRYNWFIGTGSDRARGMRIYGDGHIIHNNHFQGLQNGGGKNSYAIWLQVSNYPAGTFSREPARNCKIYFNTIANFKGYAPVLFGGQTAGYGDEADEKITGNTFKNNIFENNSSSYLLWFISSDGYSPVTTDTWTTNILDKGSASDLCAGDEGDDCPTSQIESDPSFTTRSTEYGSVNILPSSGSNALGAGTHDASYVTDIWGNTRSNPPDIGSHEYSAGNIVNHILQTTWVGPTWYEGFDYAIFDMSPEQNSTGVALNPTITFETPIGAATWDIYFDKDTNPPTTLVADDSTTESYSPAELSVLSDYYIRIDITDGNGDVFIGTVYHFTSAVGPPVEQSSVVGGMIASDHAGDLLHSDNAGNLK